MPVAVKQNRPVIDWPNCQRNYEWHDKFFAPKALRDHQAKGNCDSAALTLDYMVERGWLSEGDLILDPMCGIGSFLIVAALKGYDCIGVELEENFIKDMEGYDSIVDDYDDMFFMSKTHVEGNLEHFRRVTDGLPNVGSIRVFQGDARQLSMMDFSASAVLCSPPYGNRLKAARQQIAGRINRDTRIDFSEMYGSEASYSDDPKNIGNAKIKVLCSPPYNHGEHSEAKIDSIPDEITGMRVHEYLNPSNIANIDGSSKYNHEMLKVYNSLYTFLAPGAVVALVTRNFIQDKKVVRLDSLTIRLMERAGFMYLETKRANNPEVSFFRQINHNKIFKKYGLPLIDWEEITFYRR